VSSHGCLEFGWITLNFAMHDCPSNDKVRDPLQHSTQVIFSQVQPH
jgi:hypothetical protein